MKMKQEHYEALTTMIKPLASKMKAHRVFLVKEGKARDIEKRLRWDLFWAANASRFAAVLYKYLNDDHIDTALKTIVKELEKEPKK